MDLVPCSFGVLSVVPNFVRLLIVEILGYARDTDEGFALVARFLTVVWWSAALRSLHNSNLPQSTEGAPVFATWVISI